MERRAVGGFFYALGAYFLWGLFPIYWKQLKALSPDVLMAHRVVLAFAFLLVMLAIRRGFADVWRAAADPRARRAMSASTLLISVNWFLFIWAVNSGHVLAASLGYYMNPLLNVLLGRVVLDEKLRAAQLVAVALALAGVFNLAVAQGTLPWISLSLAITFSLYGLVRKTAPVESMTGLAIETGLMAPIAVAYLVLVRPDAVLPPLGGWHLALLGLCGVVTGVPMLWFAEAARRLRYTTLGIVQYVAPTCQFLTAVLIYDEPFTHAHAVTFGLIWTAVAVYAVDGVRSARAPAARAIPAME